MNKTEEVNDYDYKSMLRDLESTTRHEEILKKNRKKFEIKNKKYDEAVKNCFQYKEEEYKKKKDKFEERFKEKEALYLTSVANNQKTRMAERQKAIEKMMKQEKLATENVEKFLIQQEKDRLKFQQESNEKSKKNKN